MGAQCKMSLSQMTAWVLRSTRNEERGGTSKEGKPGDCCYHYRFALLFCQFGTYRSDSMQVGGGGGSLYPLGVSVTGRVFQSYLEGGLLRHGETKCGLPMYLNISKCNQKAHTVTFGGSPMALTHRFDYSWVSVSAGGLGTVFPTDTKGQLYATFQQKVVHNVVYIVK